MGVVMAVAVAACGAESSVITTTRATVAPSTSLPPTTVPNRVEVPGGTLLKFEPGTVYVASRFWEPVSLSTDQDGSWWSRGSTELWVHLEYHDNGESVTDLDLTIVAHSPTASLEEVVASIIAKEIGWFFTPDPGNETARVITPPSPTTVGGFEASVFDLFVPRGRYDEGPNARGNTLFFQTIPGLSLLTIGDNAVTGGGEARIGIRHGRAARVWVVDVAGATITIVAAATDLDLFDDLIGAADRLVADIEFAP